jgi:quercetin dioxygenase-like cupin family protein
MAATFPPIISGLPEADLPLPLARGWLLQGETRQAVFIRLEPGATVPDHSHGAQWGVVLDGELELTISGTTLKRRKGDSYEIPEGALHAAASPTGALVLDLFADPRRYSPKRG